MFWFIVIALTAVGIATGTNYLWHVAPKENERKAKIAAEKARLVNPGYHVIGLQTGTARLVTKPDTFTQTKFDTTSYPDRAVFTLTNSTGSDVTCTGISIQGKAVVQHDAAYQWIYKDYASIERDGESSVEVSNAFIMSKDQTEALGDYVKKELSAHSMYQIHLPGCAFNYDINDLWHLTLSHTINGQVSEAESIDVDVEITRVSFSRQVGGIGETLLDCRVPSGTWSKTTSRRARLISQGLANNINSRGNILTVAASDYTGQADIYCDGTSDDVQIQYAIDDLSGRGGGTVKLTEGTYITSTNITLKDNIHLEGAGSATVIMPSIDVGRCLYATGVSGVVVKDIKIDGNNYSSSIAIKGGIVFGGVWSDNVITNVYVCNIKNSYDGGDTYGIYGGGSVVGCTVSSVVGITNNVNAYGIIASSRCEYNTVSTITKSGTGLGYGIAASKLCHHNVVSACSTAEYNTAYADSAAANACADTAAGGYNS